MIHYYDVLFDRSLKKVERYNEGSAVVLLDLNSDLARSVSVDLLLAVAAQVR